MSAKFMTINGTRYVEARPVGADHPIRGVCDQCALGGFGMLRHCAAAVMGEAEKAFGGDCETRDVIYAKATGQEGGAA